MLDDVLRDGVSTMSTVAIIGAGFCGATLAARLLRKPPTLPLNVILINRSGLPARGLAYGTRAESHLLNVPAGQMSAFPERPDDFAQYAQRHDKTYGAWSFVPRRLYGDYLEDMLKTAVDAAPVGCRLQLLIDDIRQIRPRQHTVSLNLASGATLDVDHAVLALGHEHPVDPPVADNDRSFYVSRRYIRDPWARRALDDIAPKAPVLILGSGLTMVDVVLALRERDHRGPIQVLSRRGLAPQPHRGQSELPKYATQLPARLLAQPSLRHYLRHLRTEIARAAALGYDWRDVIASLRLATPALWQALPERDQRRFLRHLRPYWDAHRHRCAPQPWRRLEIDFEHGHLRIAAGQILGYREHADGVEIRYRPRGTRTVVRQDVGAVINCTGSAVDLRRSREPLLAALQSEGIAVADTLGLGFRTDERYALIDRAGQSARRLYYVGPLLRSRFWEATAVPELRGHVAQLFEHLTRDIQCGERHSAANAPDLSLPISPTS